MAALIIYFSWPSFVQTLLKQEWSSNPGGLIIWPAKLLIPVGFSLLLLQGIAETIKRIGFLAGMEPPEHMHHLPQAEEMMALSTTQKQGDA